MKLGRNIPNKKSYHMFSFKYISQNFNFLKQSINRKCCLFISILVVLSSILISPAPTAEDIEWEVTLNFSEPGDEYAYVLFGEATDANDGPPADNYDVPSCPSPPEPYIRAWFDDGLSYPYDTLWGDYRKYSPSNAHKIWNLTVHWQSSVVTLITITWDPNMVDDTEYGSVILYNIDSSTIVANMLVDNYYTFTLSSYSNTEFQIIATTAGNNPPIANDDNYNTNEDAPLNVAAQGGVLSNDIDNDGPLLLTAELVNDVLHGILDLNDDGSFKYVPEKDWNGNDVFIYKAYDGMDYSDPSTVNIAVAPKNDPPYTPSNPNPENFQTDVDRNIDLSWIGGDPDSDDTVTYDVYFGTSNPPSKVASNQSVTFYDPGTMSYETTYYWKIISWDSHDEYTEGQIWYFTIEEEPEPILEIVSISGGFGVSTVIENVGIVDATDVEWSISLNGGIVLRPSARIKEGTIPILETDDTITKSTSILGFGRIDITVMAGEVEKTTKGFILLFYVIIFQE